MRKRFFSRSFLKKLLIQSFIFLVLFELLLMLFTKIGWLNSPVPSYSVSSNTDFVGAYDEDIGYLHRPGGHSHFYRSCYDFVNNYNDEGFRDINRKRNSADSRILFLGDSFTEGFGVNVSDRFSNKLEKALNKECINFGISGLSPVQYQEVYRKYGQHYAHDAVVVSIYPLNDFEEDRILPVSERFKPSWIEENDQWKFQPPTFHPTRPAHHNKGIKAYLQAYSYTYNFLAYYKGMLFGARKQVLCDHHSFEQKDWERMQCSLKEIKKMAGNRKLIIFSIPALTEIQETSSPETNRLSEEIKRFSAANNIVFMDLAAEIFNLPLAERETLYLLCDGHLSPKGHQFVANNLQPYLRE